MLAKKFRLPIGRAYLKNSRVIAGHYFSLKKTENNLPFSRFGVIVSRQVEKSAVRRNKLKRAVFNFVRLNKLQTNPAWDHLIILRPAVIRKEKELTAELKKILMPK